MRGLGVRSFQLNSPAELFQSKTTYLLVQANASTKHFDTREIQTHVFPWQRINSKRVEIGTSSTLTKSCQLRITSILQNPTTLTMGKNNIDPLRNKQWVCSILKNNIHVYNNQLVVWILSSRIEVIHKVYLGWAPGLFGQLCCHVQPEYICRGWLEKGRKVEDWNTLRR